MSVGSLLERQRRKNDPTTLLLPPYLCPAKTLSFTAPPVLTSRTPTVLPPDPPRNRTVSRDSKTIRFASRESTGSLLQPESHYLTTKETDILYTHPHVDLLNTHTCSRIHTYSHSIPVP